MIKSFLAASKEKPVLVDRILEEKPAPVIENKVSIIQEKKIVVKEIPALVKENQVLSLKAINMVKEMCTLTNYEIEYIYNQVYEMKRKNANED